MRKQTFEVTGREMEGHEIATGMYLSFRPTLLEGAVVLDYHHKGKSINYREAHLSPELLTLLNEKLDAARCTVLDWKDEDEQATKLRVFHEHRNAFNTFFKEHKVTWTHCKRILKAEALAPLQDEPSVPAHLEFACHPEWEGWTGVDARERQEELKQRELLIPPAAQKADSEILRVWASEGHYTANWLVTEGEDEEGPFIAPSTGAWAEMFANVSDDLAVILSEKMGRQLPDIIHEMRTVFNHHLGLGLQAPDLRKEKDVKELERMFKLSGRKGSGKVVPLKRKEAANE